MPTLQEAQELAKRKLGPGEQLLDVVAGPIAGEAFNSIVALTTTHLRIIIPSGGSAFELSSISTISWAPAWARLNIDLKSPRRRLVLAVFGSEWKTRAKALADAAKPHIPK